MATNAWMIPSALILASVIFFTYFCLSLLSFILLTDIRRIGMHLEASKHDLQLVLIWALFRICLL